MPDTRFSLIGKACVMIVRASDSELRTILKKVGFKGIRRKTKSGKKRKGRFKKGSAEAKRYMARIRRMR